MGNFKARKARTGFNRPSANVGSVNREWRTVPISDLAIGDIVAGKGIVKLVFQTCNADEYFLEAGETVEDCFDGSELVYAFVKKED